MGIVSVRGKAVRNFWKVFGSSSCSEPSECEGPPALLVFRSTQPTAGAWGFLEKQRLKGVNAFKQTGIIPEITKGLSFSRHLSSDPALEGLLQGDPWLVPTCRMTFPIPVTPNPGDFFISVFKPISVAGLAPTQ